MLDIIFNVAQFLSIMVATAGIGGFAFMLRHKSYYSKWARSAVLMGGITSALHAYDFDAIKLLIMGAEVGTEAAVLCVIIQSMVSLTLALFTYTILRFKWRWQDEHHKVCSSMGCPKIKT